MSKPRHSIVVPVYRGARSIAALHERVAAVMSGLEGGWELIFVDDGSPDDSWQVIRGLVAKDARVQGLQLMRNFGQASATVAGLAATQGELITTLDDDLQNPPEEIPRLIAALEAAEGLDVVIGAPLAKRHASWRNLASGIINRINNRIFEREASFRLTSFVVMHRRVVDPLLAMNLPNPATGALISTFTRGIVNITVAHAERAEGRSGYTLGKMFRLTLDRLLGFSTLPLRALATTGLIGVCASVVLALWYLVQFLRGSTEVPGWTTQVLLLVGLSGFNFLAFGIIGEYLQQILLSVRQTPAFLVRHHCRREDGEEPTSQP